MSDSNPEEIRVAQAIASDDPASTIGSNAVSRTRGRPVMMSPNAVIERIRQLAHSEGLYKVHHAHSGLYARARRQFGSWAGAVQAAGVDYGAALFVARRRSIETRRKLRRERAHAPR
jgi:hypothetical protein